MKFITTVIVQPFERIHAFSFIDFLSKTLPDFGITGIDVMYGWAWGNDIFNWETRTIALDTLKAEIEHIERQGFGKIGDDDLVIKINSHYLEIILCHETDLHIKFDILTPLVEKILGYVSLAFSTITQEKQSLTSPAFFSDKPTYLVSCDFTSDDFRPITINLEQWARTLECSPKEELRITGYGSQAGLLKFEQNENLIRIKGWSSSNIRVHCDKQLLLDTKGLVSSDVSL
jgi:hypothetical protein